MKITIHYREFRDYPDATEYDRRRAWCSWTLNTFGGLFLLLNIGVFFESIYGYCADNNWTEFFIGICHATFIIPTCYVFILFNFHTELGLKLVIFKYHKYRFTNSDYKGARKAIIKNEFLGLREKTIIYFIISFLVLAYIAMICILVFSIVRLIEEDSGNIGWFIFSITTIVSLSLAIFFFSGKVGDAILSANHSPLILEKILANKHQEEEYGENIFFETDTPPTPNADDDDDEDSNIFV
jgi:hypothetical protein